MIGMWVPSMQPITPGNPKIYQIDWLVLQVSKLYDINELLLRLIPAILWNSSLRSLVGLWLGNTTNVHSSRFSASVTFRTARQTVSLDTCSASPTLYKKLPLAKKRSAIQRICSEQSVSTMCHVSDVRAENIVYINYWWCRETETLKQVATHQGMIKHPSICASTSTGSSIKGHAMSATAFSLQAST